MKMKENFISVEFGLKEFSDLLEYEYYLEIFNNNEEILFNEYDDNCKLDIDEVRNLINENIDSVKSIKLTTNTNKIKTAIFKLKENSALEAKIRLELL